LFAFDNASNHNSFALDTFVSSRMNLNSGGNHPKTREGFMHSRGRVQQMGFPEIHLPEVHQRGEPKGVKRVLQERGL